MKAMGITVLLLCFSLLTSAILIGSSCHRVDSVDTLKQFLYFYDPETGLCFAKPAMTSGPAERVETEICLKKLKHEGVK